MSPRDWLAFVRRAGVVVGVALSVAFLPSTAWAADEPSPTSTSTPAESPSSSSPATSEPTETVTETKTATETATETATATATETVTAEPPAGGTEVQVNGDQFTVVAVGLALVVVCVGVLAGAVVSRG